MRATLILTAAVLLAACSGATTSGSSGGSESGSASSSGGSSGGGLCGGGAIFCDDFSSAALAGAYAFRSGSWTRSAGSLVVSDEVAWQRARAVLADDVDDFDVTLAGSSLGDSGFGLVYAASAARDDGFAVIVHPGQFRGVYLKKLVPGEPDVEIQHVALDAPSPGVAHTLRVARVSGSVTVWLDGAALFTASDSGGHGALGLLESTTDQTSGAGARFTLFRVDSIDLGGSSTGSSGSSGASSGSTGAGALSGLAWNSGASSEDASGFAAWRGHPLDVADTWDNRSSWDEIQHPDIYGGISGFAGFAGRLALGTAMLPGDGATLASGVSFAACASGDYDGYFQQLGRDLASLGRDDSFIRLGWEANGNWYAWNADNAASPAEWVSCFRHEALAIKSTAPRARIDWNMNFDTKTPSQTHNPADLYPGDDVVDVIGVDQYDNWPALISDADWDAHYMDSMWGPTGGPKGLGAWLAFARSHGKPLSVPEWGIVNATGNCGCGGDNPVFVQHMHDFFAQNAADLAYEVYFNLGNYGGDTTFLVYPSTTSPNASARYQSLF